MTYIETINNLPVDETTDARVVHHIIPKSLGGSNNKDNLIILTPAQHMWVHVLREREGNYKSACVFLNSLGVKLEDIKCFEDCLPYNKFFESYISLVPSAQKEYWADPEKRAYRIKQYSESHKGKENCCRERLWVYNGETLKRIRKEDYEAYTKNGYWLSSSRKTRRKRVG